MIYELLDTSEHPLVVVGTIEEINGSDHPADCPCGRRTGQALKVVLEGNAPAAVKATGLLVGVASLLSDEDTPPEECDNIRRSLARLLAATS